MCPVRDDRAGPKVRLRRAVSGQDDRDWIVAARSGSPSAFRHLVAMHQAGLVAFLRRVAPAEAEDIAQETFLFAWRALDRFDANRSFRAWLFGIGWRKCRESRRGLLRRLRRQGAAVENASTAARADPDTALDLSAAIDRLAPEERAALLLCLMAGFAQDEAAQVMNLSPRNIKSLVARARQNLGRMMGEDDAGR